VRIEDRWNSTEEEGAQAQRKRGRWGSMWSNQNVALNARKGETDRDAQGGGQCLSRPVKVQGHDVQTANLNTKDKGQSNAAGRLDATDYARSRKGQPYRTTIFWAEEVIGPTVPGGLGRG